MEFYCGGACFRNFMRSKFSASIKSLVTFMNSLISDSTVSSKTNYFVSQLK